MVIYVKSITHAYASVLGLTYLYSQTRRLESRLSMMIVVLGLSVFPPSCEGLKLENYMHTDKSEVIASSAASLSKRQPKFFFRVRQ